MSRNRRVYEAIVVGQIVINLPILLFIVGGCYLLATVNVSDSIVFKVLLGVVGGLASLVASWKYWSIAITRWRVWAFSRVEERDLLQLKSLAIKTKDLWRLESYEYETLKKYLDVYAGR